MSNTTTVSAQLRALLTLTEAEIQIARTRTAQARTEAVKRELHQNAVNARERAKAIETALRDNGGVPAVLAPALGRVTAIVKAAFEQAQPFDEALIGDLGLEHQLLDRAHYLKALAVSDGRRDIESLADRLVVAHTATVEWLLTVLAEEALGGPVALRRSPTQAVAGALVGVVNVPANWTYSAFDHAADAVRTVPQKLRDAIGRPDVVDAEDLPIADYDDLTVANAVDAIRGLSEPVDIRTVVAYEERNKNRQGVVSASQTHLASIAREAVGV